MLETREVQGTYRLDLANGDLIAVMDYTHNLEVVAEPFVVAGSVRVPAGRYAFQQVRSVYQLGPQRKISGAFTIGAGSFFGGYRTEASYRGRIGVTPNLTFEPGITINWLDLPEGRATATLLSTRATLTLTPRMFVSALVQENSSSSSLGSSVRLRWEFRPGSDLFVVYSEGRDTDTRGFPGLANRTFVVKATRLVRF